MASLYKEQCVKEYFEKIPKELWLLITNFINLKDLFNIFLSTKVVSKTLASTMKTLQTTYQLNADKSPQEIVAACLDNTLTAQAIIMSKLAGNLDVNDLIKIGLMSPLHAEILLRSRFIQPRQVRRLAKTNMPKTNDLPSSINEIDQIQFLMDDTFTDVLNSEFAFNKIPSFWKRREAILSAMVTKDASIASLVLVRAIDSYNGYKLMEIAKISIAHTKVIFQNFKARNQLKQGHIIGIGKASPEHAEYILNYHFSSIGAEGARQIALQGKNFTTLVIRRMVALLSKLPMAIVTQQPKALKMVVQLLVKNAFYQYHNPFWKRFSENQPKDARIISEALSVMIFDLHLKEIFIRSVLIKMMQITYSYAKEILSIAEVSAVLDAKLLQPLTEISPDYKHLIDEYSKGYQATATRGECKP